MSKLAIWGIQDKTEIGGFTVIGRKDQQGGCVAYVSNKDDATLFCAAPELLEACISALGHLTGNMDGDMELDNPVERLRAAIAKALEN